MGATLTNSWEGWDYFSDGTVIDNNSGDYYFQGEKVWSPEPAPGGAINIGAGWNETLQGIAGLAANTWAQKTLMQQNQTGQRYIEGQRGLIGQGGGGMGGLLLLAGAGLLLFALAK